MSVVDLIMPKLGESIMEATILKWHKQPGERVEQDENILDIATDKVDSEVPSTAEGIITEILYKENDVVPIGEVIARIETGDGVAASIPHRKEEPEDIQEIKSVDYEDIKVPYVDAKPQPQNDDKNAQGQSIRFYSPLVLNIAQSEGLPMQELENIPGTGQDGRVSKKDILAYISSGKKGSTQKGEAAQTSQQVAIVPQQKTERAEQNLPVQYQGNVEIIEMDRMRKLIAKHMTDSVQTSAHVTSFAECDVTNLVQWRNRVKKDFEQREGTKITFTPLFIEAIVKCIKRYPWLSSSVDGDKIIVKKDIGIGMATSLPSGNLIVPVIKNADQLNLVGLAKQVNNLADAARSGKLKPDDTSGGTFTLTNVGTFGSIMGTPIINQPQVAIMAVGAIKKRPMVIETPQGDSIAIRHMMYISLSYDHRIIDGALGSTFLGAVSKELENFDPNRTF